MTAGGEFHEPERPSSAFSVPGLLVTADRARELRAASVAWPSLVLAGRDLADLECLLSGAFWPLGGYQSRLDASSVDERLCLADGRPWPTRVTLGAEASFAKGIERGSMVALREAEGVMLAALRVAEVWDDASGWHVAGPLEGIELPPHHDFRDLRKTPAQLASEVRRAGWASAIAYYPGRVLHAGHRAALLQLAERVDAGVVVVVPVEGGEHGDLGHFARVHAHKASARLLPHDRATLMVVSLSLPQDPWRARLLAAVVARNLGCARLAVDAEVPPVHVAGLRARGGAIGIEALQLPAMRRDEASGAWIEVERDRGFWEDRAPSADAVVEALAAPDGVPEWLLSRGEVEALEHVFVPRHRQGFTVFFTGLSGSGKSTVANALRVRLMEATGRPVTFLDGDLVRRHLSSELGFSREHRDLNILRIGWVSSEITRHGGIAICAPIAPYDAIRRQVRNMIEPVGGFVLVHVATPLDVCEQRDRKGLYAKARAGLIPQFTGVSDPYEVPADAALTIDTTVTPVDDAVAAVIAWLTSQGYLTVA